METSVPANSIDVADCPVETEDLPEQAQWERENAAMLKVRLEIWLNRMVGRNQRFIWWLTIAMSVLPLSLHAAIDAPYLLRHMTPYLPMTLGILFFTVFTLFLVNSFMDPGVVQPYLHSDLLRLEQQLRIREGMHYVAEAFIVTSDNPTERASVRRQSQWLVNGQTVITEFCYHCRLYQAPRVHHCQLCGRCVERFDHHCPWLDNCVGLRNYPYFILMLIIHGVMWIVWIASVIVHIVMRSLEHWTGIVYLPACLIQIGIGIANLHFLYVLLSCQRDLLKLGLTVHEFKTDKYYNRSMHRFRSPFDCGSLRKNMVEAFWKPWRPLSYLPNLAVDLITPNNSPQTPSTGNRGDATIAQKKQNESKLVQPKLTNPSSVVQLTAKLDHVILI
ncbi:palmitoyltransferase ZDHHC14-like isoform X2 [Paramacrobiotus metropolitanus]|uniref:palmitoyltransferase ZDHHC14-like isoform X2 n=1 Tax=Paramacrobiotus metropolitanus TaxID=2943436 RepID=UPI002445BE2A|nr:palmitoyltransferase ZDHHC14-like isoform X2 [Paramacrobiotus metropolitanus]